MSYDLIAHNQYLSDCVNMTLFEKIKNIFKRENEMTKEILLKSLEFINLYESKKVSVLKYRLHIAQHTNTKSCRTCSGGNNLDNIHKRFQQRVFNEIKNKHPEIIKPLQLESGKYKKMSLKFEYYPYNLLYTQITTMRKEAQNLKKKGYQVQFDLINKDIESLVRFISYRKGISVQKCTIKADKTPVVSTPIPVAKKETFVSKEAPESTVKAVEIPNDSNTIIVDSTANLPIKADKTSERVYDSSEHKEIKSAEIKTPMDIYFDSLESNEDEITLKNVIELVDIEEKPEEVVEKPKKKSKPRAKKKILEPLVRKSKKDFTAEEGLRLKNLGYSVSKIAISYGLSRQYASTRINKLIQK